MYKQHMNVTSFSDAGPAKHPPPLFFEKARSEQAIPSSRRAQHTSGLPARRHDEATASTLSPVRDSRACNRSPKLRGSCSEPTRGPVRAGPTSSTSAAARFPSVSTSAAATSRRRGSSTTIESSASSPECSTSRHDRAHCQAAARRGLLDVDALARDKAPHYLVDVTVVRRRGQRHAGPETAGGRVNSAPWRRQAAPGNNLASHWRAFFTDQNSLR
jgi:hypothetical protein